MQHLGMLWFDTGSVEGKAIKVLGYFVECGTTTIKACGNALLPSTTLPSSTAIDVQLGCCDFLT
jgi:hypothetical protein